MEERTLTTSKGGRPSFLDEIKDGIIKDFKRADMRMANAFHLKTVYATKLMEERETIKKEIAKIKDARRKGYILDYKNRVINKELEKLGVTK